MHDTICSKGIINVENHDIVVTEIGNILILRYGKKDNTVKDYHNLELVGSSTGSQIAAIESGT